MKQRYLRLIASLILIVFVAEISIDYSSLSESDLHKDLAELVLDSGAEDNEIEAAPFTHHNLWFEIIQARLKSDFNEFRAFNQPEKTVLSWHVPLYLEDCVFLI